MKKINWPDHLLNFVAVILGVLLAFQIESIAENNKEKRELNEILQSFIEDIDMDRETYDDFQIPTNEQQSEMIGKLLTSILSNQVDSIEEQISVTFDVQNYSPISSTYLSVISSGKFGLIRDFEIKKAISDYYDVLAGESLKQGEVQMEFFLKEIIPWMVENTNILDIESEDVDGNIEFANRLVIYQTLINNKARQYKKLSKAAEELKIILIKLKE